MGERPDRPHDELRRDPLGRPDPLGRESERDVDRADAREEIELEPPPSPFNPETASPDPTLTGAPVGAEEEVDEVEASRTEIERTRADMGETVDAIQNKLSPQNLKEQAKEQAKDTAKGAGSTIMETIKENPLPAALTGIGLGWLFVSARRSSSSSSGQEARYRGDGGYDYPPAYERVAPDYDHPPLYEERGSSGPSTGQALERTRDSVGETASQAQDRAGQVASRAQDRVSQLGSRAQEQARRAGGGFQRMLQENPLVVGALAVGAGAAVGLAVPQTAKEHEAMGEARDTLVEKAQEKAQDAKQRAQRVAEEAQSAAKEEAQNQGLTDQ